MRMTGHPNPTDTSERSQAPGAPIGLAATPAEASRAGRPFAPEDTSRHAR